jgi:hypothetical protein
MIQIVQAAPVHIAPLARTMRAADRAECAAGGMSATQALESSLARSLMAWTALDDGVPCAMWGVIADSLTDQSARAWLLTGEGVERNRKAFLTHTRAWVQRVSELFPVLTAYVAADYPQALRWLRWLGFDVLPARPMFDTKALFHPVERSATPRPAPFIVYGLPRSRTAWLSTFLSYDGWTCHHEMAIHMRSVDDVRAFFAQPKTGTCETAAGQGWRILHHHVPDLRAVVVRRHVDDVVDAMMAVDVEGVATYDRAKLRANMEYGARVLDQISARPGVLTVDYEALERKDVCAAVFEHCLGVDMPDAWFERWRGVNVQADVKAVLNYYFQHRTEIDSFKRAMKSELRQLVKLGAIQKEGRIHAYG